MRSNTITILCNGQWWSFSSAGKLLFTNVPPDQRGSHPDISVRQGSNPPDLEDLIDGVPLIDPSFLLTSHELQLVADNIIHAEREAVRVRATYRKGKNRIHEAFFWSTADEYDLLVDKDRGILLRYAAKLDDQEFAVASVEKVIFDELISEDVFSFSLPANS
jgi:hypothetical protein